MLNRRPAANQVFGVGATEFPGCKERPVSSTVIEKRKEIAFSRCRHTWFARLLVSRFNKQKEEVHGNRFDRNFQKCGGNKLLAGCSGRFGTAFLRADLSDGWSQSF
jgi:hypothetical protein